MKEFNQRLDDFENWEQYNKAKKAHYQKELPQYSRALSEAEYEALSSDQKTEYVTWRDFVLYAKCD